MDALISFNRILHPLFACSSTTSSSFSVLALFILIFCPRWLALSLILNKQMGDDKDDDGNIIKKWDQYLSVLCWGILLVDALPLNMTGCGFSILITEDDLTILFVFYLLAPLEFSRRVCRLLAA